ncbi:MAG: hypothetical protein MJZ64_04295 [Paludibacteraceae bacterium]|nr:hypothetical protein [Paludibacteraceae bacterium]
MQITFTEPSKAEETKKHWKAIDAPCVLRKTSNPCVFSVMARKGVDSKLFDLFIAEAVLAEAQLNKVKRMIYKDCTKEQIEEYEKQLLLYKV